MEKVALDVETTGLEAAELETLKDRQCRRRLFAVFLQSLEGRKSAKKD